MNKEKLKNKAQQPAFAASDAHDSDSVKQEGISKRLYIATQVVCGIRSGYVGVDLKCSKFNIKKVVGIAYKYADELLKQEDNYE